ncbi:FUSC family protein, partial [Oceaniovalibus guishaninsula]|uniref:FUSC family protein n=1 Tax=Oceaniovalibus guishaninsula TaxID=1046117 RepID=UPI0012E9B0D8
MPFARLPRLLDRLDPGRSQARYAAMVAAATVATYGILYLTARLLDLPLSGAVLGATVAQYLGWFITAPTLRQVLRQSIAATVVALPGLGLALWLTGAIWPSLAVTTVLTAAAFVFRAWSAGMRTVALTASYTFVFAVYLDITAQDAVWSLAAVLVGGLVATLVRFLLWRGPSPRRGDLVRAYLLNLSAFLRRAAKGAPEKAQRRLRARTTPTELRLTAAGGEDAKVAALLVRLRVHATDAALCDDPGGADLADALDGGGRAEGAAGAILHEIRALGYAEDRVRVPPAPDDSPDPPFRVRLKQAAQRAVQVALALAVALPLGYWIDADRWAWAYLAAMLVLYGTGTADDVLVKGWRRVRGTVIGGVGGLLIAGLLRGDIAVEVASIIILQFLAVYFQTFSYAWMMAASTALLALFFGVSGNPVPSVMGLRLGETLAGALVGFVVSQAVFPSRARRRSRDALDNLLTAIAAVLGRDGDGIAADNRLAKALTALQAASA